MRNGWDAFWARPPLAAQPVTPAAEIAPAAVSAPQRPADGVAKGWDAFWLNPPSILTEVAPLAPPPPPALAAETVPGTLLETAPETATETVPEAEPPSGTAPARPTPAPTGRPAAAPSAKPKPAKRVASPRKPSTPKRALRQRRIITLTALGLMVAGAIVALAVATPRQSHRDSGTAGLRVFDSPRYPYRIGYPRSWEASSLPYSNVTADLFRAPTSGGYAANLNVIAESVTAETTTESYLEANRRQLATRSIHMVGEQAVNLGGQICRQVETVGGVTADKRQIQVYCVQGGRGWVFTFTTTRASFAQDETTLSAMLESVNWR